MEYKHIYNKITNIVNKRKKSRIVLRREEPESIITFYLTYTCIRIYNYYNRKYKKEGCSHGYG